MDNHIYRKNPLKLLRGFFDGSIFRWTKKVKDYNKATTTHLDTIFLYQDDMNGQTICLLFVSF